MSLRSNVVWTFGGTLVYSLAQWAMLASISKLGSPYMVGQFALGLAVSAPIYMFTNMQLRTIQATDAKGIFSFPDYFGLRVLASATGFAAVLLFALLNSGSGRTQLVVLVIGAAKCFESLSDAVYGLCQKHERMMFISISLCIKGIGSVAALIIILRQLRTSLARRRMRLAAGPTVTNSWVRTLALTPGLASPARTVKWASGSRS